MIGFYMSVPFFFFLYFIITFAVRNGIDKSNEIQILKSELRELNSRVRNIESESIQKGRRVDKKI